jgi:ABC-type glycerol-3-phosphate transport system permease component
MGMAGGYEMTNKRKWRDLFLIAVLLAGFITPFAIIGVGMYATIDACGWRGLFVQCRIEVKP